MRHNTTSTEWQKTFTWIVFHWLWYDFLRFFLSATLVGFKPLFGVIDHYEKHCHGYTIYYALTIALNVYHSLFCRIQLCFTHSGGMLERSCSRKWNQINSTARMVAKFPCMRSYSLSFHSISSLQASTIFIVSCMAMAPVWFGNQGPFQCIFNELPY